MAKIFRPYYISVFAICFSLAVCSQLVTASPSPGDEAIIAGNMTLDLAPSQPPVEANESVINNSIANQTNQTIRMTMNETL